MEIISSFTARYTLRTCRRAFFFSFRCFFAFLILFRVCIFFHSFCFPKISSMTWMRQCTLSTSSSTKNLLDSRFNHTAPRSTEWERHKESEIGFCSFKRIKNSDFHRVGHCFQYFHFRRSFVTIKPAIRQRYWFYTRHNNSAIASLFCVCVFSAVFQFFFPDAMQETFFWMRCCAAVWHIT